MKKRILSTLLTLCMALAMLPGTALAAQTDSGYCGYSASWSLDRSGVLTISGRGRMYDFDDDYDEPDELPPWYRVRDEIREIVVGGVSNIGEYAFAGCTEVTDVTISEGVTLIGDEAFAGCSSLTSVTIPSSVTWIEEEAFYRCFQLADVYYAGTRQEWNRIRIEEKNYNLTSAGIHYDSANPDDPDVPVTCIVTFDTNDGSEVPDEVEYEVNETLGTLPTPTRSGYKFNGWYTAASGGRKVTASQKVTGDMTLYAHWTRTTRTYTIKLNANSGTVSPSSIKVESGKTYFDALPTPTRSGYKFDGWYTSRTGGTKITSTTKATANRTIYAHWAKDTAPKTYLITFDPNGGSVFTRYAAVVNGGTYRSLPTPSYPGRHFAGWYTASSGGTKVTPQTKVSLTGNRTLYAHWTTSPVSVRSMESGSWRVTVPAGSRLALYGSETSAAQATSATISRDTALTCTRMAVLSNGTVRYYAKINSGSSYWFCYSDEMAVN